MSLTLILLIAALLLQVVDGGNTALVKAPRIEPWPITLHLHITSGHAIRRLSI